MARAAHPEAMKPHTPGRTRTAPPLMPDGFPARGRYLPYVLFDATGVIYMLVGLAALRIVWDLGSGPEAWSVVQEQLRHPLYLGFHGISLVSVIFVGVRFFRLFPKSQPPKIGPVAPPPEPVIKTALYVVWIGVAGAMTFILAGGIF
jgi:fumarate reductase subunit C